MNLGQRIWKKHSAGKEIDEEIKEIEAIINQINKNETSVPKIDLNLKLNTIYGELEAYIKIVDEKLFEIQKKYFEPNWLYFNINICKTELYEGGYISVDSREDTVKQLEFDFVKNNSEEIEGGYISVDSREDTVKQLEFDFIKNNSEEIEYQICDELFYKWEEYLLDDLLAALNISKLALLLGAMWHVNDYEDKNFKLIQTNRDI